MRTSGREAAPTMNKQPYYHRATLLFTATRPVDRQELVDLLNEAIEKLPKDDRADIVVSVDVENCDSEPGDPADLL